MLRASLEKKAEVVEIMKALSIHQPYADMIVQGLKVTENRTWRTDYRGPLLIHASKSKDACIYLDPESVINRRFGCIVGCVYLFDMLAPGILRDMLDKKLKPWIDWCPPEKQKHIEGPFCWCMREAREFERAIPYRGQQGLFDINPQEVAALQEAELTLFK